MKKWLRLTTSFAVIFGAFNLGISMSIQGPTLMDLIDILHVNQDMMSYSLAYAGLAYSFGGFLSGFIFNYVNRQLLVIAYFMIFGIANLLTPWITSYLIFSVITFSKSMAGGGTDCGANVWILEMWPGQDAWLQALHFSFALGTALGPLLAEPFLSPELPDEHELERLHGPNYSQLENFTMPEPGESRIYVPYSISGFLSILASFVLLALYIYDPYIPPNRSNGRDPASIKASNNKKQQLQQQQLQQLLPIITTTTTTTTTTPNNNSQPANSDIAAECQPLTGQLEQQQQLQEQTLHQQHHQEPKERQLEQTPPEQQPLNKLVQEFELQQPQRQQQQQQPQKLDNVHHHHHHQGGDEIILAIQISEPPPGVGPHVVSATALVSGKLDGGLSGMLDGGLNGPNGATNHTTTTTTTTTIATDNNKEASQQKQQQPVLKVKITSKAPESDGPTPFYVIAAIFMAASCLLFYCGIEITSMNYLATFAVNTDLQLSKSTAAYLSSALTASFAVGRGIGIWVAINVKPHILFYGCVIMVVIGNVAMLFFAHTNELFLWISVCFFGIGCGPMFPAIVSFFDERISKVTNTVSGIFILASMFQVALSSLIVGHHIIDNALILIELNLISSVLLLVLFGGLHLLTKVKKNQRVRKYRAKEELQVTKENII